MPMDYDDDDISRHNLQLASEGRSRSSSVLRPYDFPNFDFDDNLPGNIRFDSLVETEVFLGIQSQEDNQWIEDYSKVSNGMEFNSTPADSCSISRRDNVWSEATSSESVEMLLKSVGQEVVVPEANNIPGTNVCNDLGASASNVESGMDLDMRNLDTTQVEVHEDSSEDSLCEEKVPSVEASALKSENAEFSCEHPLNLTGDTVCVGSGMLENEEPYTEPADECLQEPKALGCSQGVMLSTSEVLPETSTNASGNVSGQERHVLTGTLEDIMNLEGKTEKGSIDVSTMGDTPCLVLESSVKNITNAVKLSRDDPMLGDFGSSSSMEEHELIVSKGDEKNLLLRTSVQTDDSEITVLPTSNEMENPLDGCQDGSSVDGNNQHSIELGCFSEHGADPDQKRDTSMQLIPRQDNWMLEDVQTESQSRSLSETPLLEVEDKNVSIEKADWIYKTDIGKSNNTDLVSSETPVLPVEDNKVSLERDNCIDRSDTENHQTKEVDECLSDSVFIQEGLVAQAGYVAGDSSQVIEKNMADAQADFSAAGKAIRESSELDGRLPVCHGNVAPENVETLTSNLESQSVGEDEEDTGNDSLHELQTETSGGIKAADELALPADSIAAAAIADCLENGQEKLSLIDFPTSDNNPEEDGISKTADAHFSVSEAEAASVPVQSMLFENAVLESVKKCNEIRADNCPSTEAINSLNDPNDNLGCEKTNLKESCDVDIGDGDNHEVTIMNSRGDQESAEFAEADKASCGSPTIICSSEASQIVTDGQEEARGSEVTENDVKGSQPSSEDIKGKDSLGDDNSFTFKVDAVPDSTREPGKSWSPFQDSDKCNPTVVNSSGIQEKVAKESIPSCKDMTERLPSPKTPRHRATAVQSLQGTAKSTYERKGRRASGKGAAKESGKKGSQAKGTNQEDSAGTVDKGSNSSLSTPSSSPYVQFGHMQSFGNVEESSKLPLPGSLPTSSLPDLNASALNKSISTAPTSRQPFTDSQQVQLRAQIFVYGSLIQGTAPDEACMISAFGPSDAGRITWDSVWRTAIERVRTQKSSSSNTPTPLHSQSGAKASDMAAKHSIRPSTMQATPVSKVNSKDTPGTMASPMIPLSSPLWSISTPSRDSLASSVIHKGSVVDFQQTVTPLHSYQTPPVRSFNGHTSWPSQPCFPGPWPASPQTSTFSQTVRFRPVTMTETVKLTPVKENALPLASGVKHLTSTPAVHSVGSSPVYGVSPLPDTKRKSPELHSGDPKPRKRKKITAPEPQILPVVIHSVDVVQSSPVGAPTPAVGSSLTKDSTVCYTEPSKKCEPNVACSEEALKNVVEAKAQAENASFLASNAVSLCEDLWGKLSKQKESDFTSETETKLMSAAAAIAASASVAKAAAAAAKVASNAALLAKLLADEAFLPDKADTVVQTSAKFSSDSHVSILKGEKSSTESKSVIVAAKEAAKRRVEAASAASKQAENLDAIVKAAELAALAVSQAGKIVAMGDPLPLADLIEAGPDGYWKLPQTKAELAGRSSDENKEQSVAVDVMVSEEDLVAKGGSRKRSHSKTRHVEKLKDSIDAQMSFTDGIMGPLDKDEKKSRSRKDGKKSAVVTSEPDIALRFKDSLDAQASLTDGLSGVKFTGVTSESDSALRTSSMQNENDNLAGTLFDESIKEGSFVEVLKCEGSLKSAWYSASVLKLEDRKAYVCYTDLSSEEGSENLCEWVRVEGEGENAPMIRAAQPLNSLQYQGTRKRRRAAFGDYAWGVGDKVDVWIDDCWWEGVVTEKNDKDETTLKVHFPAQGDTSIVRAWNLRTSRSWIDGKWVEWTSSKAQNSSDQSDEPQEKRQKMGSPVIATKEKDKLNNGGKLADGNPVESEFLPLSTSERAFNVGKNTKDDSKGVGRRPLRSGPPKEKSRVVFGIPKPTGKTQKFMDVSKHFPARKGDKKKETSDQVKVAKSLMPQATGSQGWKVPSRNYSREQRTIENRPRVPSTRKSNRTLPQRDNLGSRSNDMDSGTDHGTDVEDYDNSSVKMTDHGFGDADDLAEAPLSSLLPNSLSGGSKKAPLSNSRSGGLNRRKVPPSGGKLNKIEEDRVYTAGSRKFVNETSEPRRSNRQFQPTHRLLEGMQSSSAIPRMPSVSHDKVQRNPSRNAFTRGK